MKIQGARRGNTLCIYLSGELDEHSVAEIREKADSLIDRCGYIDRAVFDLTGVRFMDSTGIGFLMGRYKKLCRLGVKMYLENPDPNADKVLTLAGVYALCPKLQEAI